MNAAETPGSGAWGGTVQTSGVRERWMGPPQYSAEARSASGWHRIPLTLSLVQGGWGRGASSSRIAQSTWEESGGGR
jgi:hypothetical protein